VEATGERHFVQDHGLLESALARPRNFFSFGEKDILVLGVVLMAGAARAHAFEQGNKRTAFEALWHFLRINGYDLGIDDTQRWANAVIALVEHPDDRRGFRQSHSPVCDREVAPQRRNMPRPGWHKPLAPGAPRG
jgi:prophage maintenance system killer protein